MENVILISVIIPVYNAEKFVDQAIQSVLCQMDGSIELVLVDDGSQDQSGAICDVYAADHTNIRVIHKKNGGLSSARNAGISVASGKYLMFLDADDYLQKDTFVEIEAVIQKECPDCIDFGWRYISNGEPMPPAFHKLPKNTLLGEKELTEKILPPLLNLCGNPDYFVFDFSCNKVFLREIISRNHILFDESRRIWEDRPFVVHYLRYCKNYYAMDRCFYNYVEVLSSLSRSYSLDFFRIIVENYKQYSALFGDQFDFDTQYANNHWCYAIENMIFRSLAQTENTAQIRQNILQTLTDTQVVHWYARRNPVNQFERRVSQLVVSGKSERALLEYEKNWRKKQKKQAIECFVYKAKQVVKKLLGR